MSGAKAEQAGLDSFDELWDYGAPAATEESFRIVLARTANATDPDRRAQLLTQIARAQGLQRRFDDAHATLDEVEAMLGDETPVARVRYLLERGRVFNSSKQPDRAKPLFLEAWEAGRVAGAEYHAVDAAHMMAIVEPPEESMRWNEEALELAERSRHKRTRHWIGSVSNNIGWSHHSAGEHERALSMFERALAARIEEDDAKEIRVARWCVARCLRSLGRTDEALEMQFTLLREYEAEKSGDGYVDEEIGECLLALGRGEEARPHFASAHSKLSADPWLVENETERLDRLKRLSES